MESLQDGRRAIDCGLGEVLLHFHQGVAPLNAVRSLDWLSWENLSRKPWISLVFSITYRQKWFFCKNSLEKSHDVRLVSFLPKSSPDCTFLHGRRFVVVVVDRCLIRQFRRPPFNELVLRVLSKRGNSGVPKRAVTDDSTMDFPLNRFQVSFGERSSCQSQPFLASQELPANFAALLKWQKRSVAPRAWFFGSRVVFHPPLNTSIFRTLTARDPIHFTRISTDIQD